VKPVIARYERLRRQTFAITWLVYAGYYLTRQSFSVAKDALEADPLVHLLRREMGLIDSAYLAVYSLGQFVFGPLSDRFGPRRILILGMSLSMIAAAGFGLSTTLAAFLACAILQGIAQSTGWTATSKAMSSWFFVGERGRVLGWWCTHYTVGAAIAAPFAGWLMDVYARPPAPGEPAAPYWPAAFWGPAAVLGGIVFLTWKFLRDRPEDVGLPPIEQYVGHASPPPSGTTAAHDHAAQPAAAADGSSWRRIGAVLSSPGVWALAVAYFPIKLARYSFYFWGPKYVAESLGTTAFTSAMTAAWMPIGGIVGVVLSGYISDYLFGARRAPVIVLSLLLAAAVMLAGLAPIHNLWVMIAFFFLAGMFLFGPDSMVSATAAIDFGTKRGAGAATGFVNGVGSIGAILGGYLPGVLTNKDDWTLFFQISLAGLIVSAVILIPLWRTKPSAD
jgi:sugar phosphate permease